MALLAVLVPVGFSGATSARSGYLEARARTIQVTTTMGNTLNVNGIRNPINCVLLHPFSTLFSPSPPHTTTSLSGSTILSNVHFYYFVFPPLSSYTLIVPLTNSPLIYCCTDKNRRYEK